MGGNHEFLCQTRTLRDAGARYYRVAYPGRGADSHGLMAAGWTETDGDFFFGDPDPVGLSVLCGLDGQGEVWTEDGWRPCGPGDACLSPAGRPRGKRSVEGAAWRHCWALWSEAAPSDALPAVFPASEGGLFRAIQGLYEEEMGREDPDALAQWSDLVLLYARRLVRSDDRRPTTLRPLWDAVLADPAFLWSVGALAGRAAMSDETLRRACRRETGRTPMGQVAHLRMRLAASLLTVDAAPVGAVAARVGYTDPFAFSTAFKRAFGVPPGRYRSRVSERTGTLSESVPL